MIQDASNRIALLFLAAGASRRMGRDKALLPWRGQTVIAHHFEILRGIERVDPWLVTRPDDARLSAELDAIGWPREHRVVNPLAPDCDMFESIQCGIRAALSHNYERMGLALVDQILTARETFQQLVQDSAGRTGLFQPAYEGRRGHPVLMARPVADVLAKHPGPTLKHFLAEHEDCRTVIDVDDRGVVTDMDTPEAYQEQLAST